LVRSVYVVALLLCLAASHMAGAEEAPVLIPTPTLGNPGSPWEMSVQPLFGSDSQQNAQIFGGTMTIRQSFELVPFDVHYRSSNRDILSLSIPYIRRTEELRLGAADSIRSTDSGMGDISFGLKRSLRREKLSGWDGTIGMSLSLPTGQSVYSDLAEDQLPMGTGHYQTGVMLEFRRIADPLVTNFGFGIDYTMPRTHDGVEIRPGFGFTLASGIGYALNDRWVLTEQMEYTRQPNVFLQNIGTAQTETMDQAYITHALIYNPSKGGRTYSIGFSLGLNDASTDYMLTLGIQ
jgi:hypothetical protein